MHKSGYVALIGRPNAGKSTLLNQILETKLCAVTPRPQTTRNRIFGIYDKEDVQIVFQDTPGLLDPKDELHKFMVREAERALQDSDVAVWLIDSIKGFTPRERAIAESRLKNLPIPLIIVPNKIDKANQELLNELAEEIDNLSFSSKPTIIPISALLGSGVDVLVQKITFHLGEGPKFFPPEQLSDRTQRFFAAEIIREQAFICLRQEIPYSLAVQIESMKEKNEDMTVIQAVIHVERETQKGIIVGKSGETIKKISTYARKELEKLLGTKVFLELWVKVSEKWRKKERLMKDLGYKDDM